MLPVYVFCLEGWIYMASERHPFLYTAAELDCPLDLALSEWFADFEPGDAIFDSALEVQHMQLEAVEG